MQLANFIPSIAYRILRTRKTRAMAAQRGLSATSGFAGVELAEPHFLMSDPLCVTGFTLFCNSWAGQSAVLEAEKAMKRGLQITVVAKNISDILARDFVLIGAAVNLIDFDTKPTRMYNLILDGIIVHAILRNVGYGQVLDLKNEEKAARKKANDEKRKGRLGYSMVYVMGHFGPPAVARFNGNGSFFKKGMGKGDDIVAAGGIAIDLDRFNKYGNDSRIVSYAFN